MVARVASKFPVTEQPEGNEPVSTAFFSCSSWRSTLCVKTSPLTVRGIPFKAHTNLLKILLRQTFYYCYQECNLQQTKVPYIADPGPLSLC